MPEGPEVSYLQDYISNHCKGRVLQSIHILKGRYYKHGPPANYKAFVHALPLKLQEVERRGKMLILRFDRDWCIISKLGLTGWWYIDNDSPNWTKSSPNITFKFKGKNLHFLDQLSYGTLTFTNNLSVVEKEVAKLAPDVITASMQQVLARLEKKNRNPRFASQLIEDVIIDQQAIISGIGNYLKAEILYEARISPLRPIGSIKHAEWENILSAAKRVFRRQTKSVSNTDPDKYMDLMRIYMKTKDPEGNDIKKHTTKTGRTTYWVPEVQH